VILTESLYGLKNLLIYTPYVYKVNLKICGAYIFGLFFALYFAMRKKSNNLNSKRVQ
jgi:hypothetical protein